MKIKSFMKYSKTLQQNFMNFFRYFKVIYFHPWSGVALSSTRSAQDLNMTNGDFAFFTFYPVRTALVNAPWRFYLDTPDDLPRRMSAFYALKQVRCRPLSSVTAEAWPFSEFLKILFFLFKPITSSFDDISNSTVLNY